MLKIYAVLKPTLMFKSINKWISIRNKSVLIFAIVSSYLGIKFAFLVEVCCLLCKPFILGGGGGTLHKKRKKKGLIFLDRIMKNLQSVLIREKLLSPPRGLPMWSPNQWDDAIYASVINEMMPSMQVCEWVS